MEISSLVTYNYYSKSDINYKYVFKNSHRAKCLLRLIRILVLIDTTGR